MLFFWWFSRARYDFTIRFACPCFPIYWVFSRSSNFTLGLANDATTIRCFGGPAQMLHYICHKMSSLLASAYRASLAKSPTSAQQHCPGLSSRRMAHAIYRRQTPSSSIGSITSFLARLIYFHYGIYIIDTLDCVARLPLFVLVRGIKIDIYALLYRKSKVVLPRYLRFDDLLRYIMMRLIMPPRSIAFCGFRCRFSLFWLHRINSRCCQDYMRLVLTCHAQRLLFFMYFLRAR